MRRLTAAYFKRKKTQWEYEFFFLTGYFAIKFIPLAAADLNFCSQMQNS